MQTVKQIDMGGVNSYLIEKDGKFILIDVGGHMFMDQEINNRCEMLDKQLEQMGVDESNLELILLTHGDFDHSWNGAYFHKKYKAPVALHPADLFLVENPAKDSYKSNSIYRLPEVTAMFAQMQPKIDMLVDMIYANYTSYTPDIMIKEGMNLSEYGFDGEILCVPGHTDGSICVLLPSGELIAGDVFVNNQKPELPINAKDFEQLQQSIAVLMKKEITKVYPGHGAPFAISEFVM